MPQQTTIYSASTPVGGAATRAKFKNGTEKRGLVPYFVSGPLSRKGMLIGFVGTILHVACWVLALLFDIIAAGMINEDKSPAAWTFWLWGLITLLIALVALLGTTVWHMLANSDNKIPEGGAPPFLMSLLIGGAQVSLLCTLLNLVHSGNADNIGAFVAYNGTGDDAVKMTGKDLDDANNNWRNLNVWSMIFKVFVVQFLRNNQEWAGPAEAVKLDTF